MAIIGKYITYHKWYVQSKISLPLWCLNSITEESHCPREVLNLNPGWNIVSPNGSTMMTAVARGNVCALSASPCPFCRPHPWTLFSGSPEGVSWDLAQISLCVQGWTDTTLTPKAQLSKNVEEHLELIRWQNWEVWRRCDTFGQTMNCWHMPLKLAGCQKNVKCG